MTLLKILTTAFVALAFTLLALPSFAANSNDGVTRGESANPADPVAKQRRHRKHKRHHRQHRDQRPDGSPDRAPSWIDRG